ncbi:hypothetical protein T01_1747 [Trichinella spiralis]|uniref:Uncharacterized protein n=1 Tax=Trichinella spiralis TaxID=6334 RepID=A0A0V1AR84_TRISP|nr:hypothetical protein T01_1747 [Trichinella spiralis]
MHCLLLRGISAGRSSFPPLPGGNHLHEDYNPRLRPHPRKRGGRAGSNRTDDTDAEANPQIDTGVSSFNNDLGGNPVEARNDPARESGSLQLVKAILIQRENAQLTNCSQLQLSSLTKQ